MKKSVLSFGLLGCGRIAKRHAEVLSAGLNGARLSAVCDVNVDRAEAFGKQFNVPYYTDPEQFFRHKDLNVVNVLTPSGSHARDAIAAGRHHKHVVVEKPMALKLEDASQMIEEFKKGGVRLFVVKQNRYNLPIQKLRIALESGRFGRFVLATVRVRWCRDQTYYDQDDWRGTWAMDGGVFTNQASHHIDMLEWMMGDIETVYAKTATQLVNIETEDTGVAVLRFRNGALGIIEATTATRPKDLEGSVSILGEKGSVEVAGFSMNQIRSWNFDPSLPEDKEVMERFSENPPDVYGFGHNEYLKNVVECIQEDRAALVDGLEGYKSIETINALYESAETGKEIVLRFRPQASKLGRLKET